ncbi:MAG: O-antigen ligase family protein [Candidatus Hydrogenedentes bacterium]|nr:O-antigen ligase family protein [Candidatus Hydrogenedentota bacterium]
MMDAAPRTEDESGLARMRDTAAAGVALVVLALWPFTPSPATDAKYLIIGLLPGVLALQWWLHLRRCGPGALAGGVTAWVLGCFLAVNLLSAFLSAHLLYCLVEFFKLLALALLFFLTAQACRMPEQAWRMLLIVCGAIALTSVYGLSQWAGLDPFPWETRDVEEYRGLPSTYGNPNVAAHALNLGLLCALGLVSRRRTRWCVFFVLVILAHLYLTDVRAAKVAVPAGLALALAAELARRRTGSAPRAIFATVVVCGLFGIGLMAGVMGYHHVRSGTLAPSGHTFLLRYNSFYGASRMMMERPLTGFGPGAYWLENPPYWTPYEQAFFATDRKFNRNVHNELLETGVESGFPGAFLFIGFLVALLTAALGIAYRARDRDTRMLGYTLAACVTAFGVDGLFGFNLRRPASAAVFFVLAGIVAGVYGEGRGAHAGTRARPFRLGVATAACCAALVPATFAGLTFAAQTLHQEARGAEGSARSRERAIGLLKRAERLAPWDPVFSEHEGDILSESGKPREAIAAYERARARNPHWVPIHLGIAQQSHILAQTGDQAGGSVARAAIGRALALCPTLPEAHLLQGQMALTDALGIAPEDDTAERNRKSLFLSAVAHCGDALKYGLDQQEPAHLAMAQAHYWLGENKEAESALIRAVQAAPGEETTWAAFEHYAVNTGNWDSYADTLSEALASAESGRAPFPRAAGLIALRLAKDCRERLKDDTLARAAVTRGLRLQPWNDDLFGAYITLEGDIESREELRQAVERAFLMSGAPWLGGAPWRLNDRLTNPSSKADSEVALEVAEAAREAYQAKPESAARKYGWVLKAHGLLVRTSDESAKVRGDTLADLAATALAIGAVAESESLYADALELQADDTRQGSTLGRAETLYLMGKEDEALALVEGAAQTWPQSFEVALARARLLSRVGRTAEARLAYRLVLTRYALGPEDRSHVQSELDQLKPESAP